MSKILLIREAAEKALAAESDRTAQLVRKAEKYASGIILVAGFQLYEAETLMELATQQARLPCYLSLAVLGVSLFFAVLGMQLKGYADYPRGNKLWDNVKPENVSEDAAQEALVQILLKTREQNAKLNDAKVKLLSWSGWLFLAGFLLVGGSILWHVPVLPDND